MADGAFRLWKNSPSASNSVSLTSPCRPTPMACVTGESTQAKTAMPPAISATATGYSGCRRWQASAHSRPALASAISTRRAKSKSMKRIGETPLRDCARGFKAGAWPRHDGDFGVREFAKQKREALVAAVPRRATASGCCRNNGGALKCAAMETNATPVQALTERGGDRPVLRVGTAAHRRLQRRDVVRGRTANRCDSSAPAARVKTIQGWARAL